MSPICVKWWVQFAFAAAHRSPSHEDSNLSRDAKPPPLQATYSSYSCGTPRYYYAIRVTQSLWCVLCPPGGLPSVGHVWSTLHRGIRKAFWSDARTILTGSFQHAEVSPRLSPSSSIELNTLCLKKSPDSLRTKILFSSACIHDIIFFGHYPQRVAVDDGTWMHR